MNENIQSTHDDHRSTGVLYPLSVLVSDLSSPLNTGSLFRLCDALGIKRLYLCGDTPLPPNHKINKTSRSTEKYVNYEYYEDATAIIQSLREQGVFIVALEITSTSLALDSTESEQSIKDHDDICLLLGAEDHGISETLLALADLTLHIPMHGQNSSMNVISAASIACYTITQSLIPLDRSGEDND